MKKNSHGLPRIRMQLVGLLTLIAMVGLFAFACGSSDDEAAAPAPAAPAAKAAAPAAKAAAPAAKAAAPAPAPDEKEFAWST
jgi:outer membrane biosynthesis protein TonB